MHLQQWALATALLTSSISANELAIEQTLHGSTQKVESIGAFDVFLLKILTLLS